MFDDQNAPGKAPGQSNALNSLDDIKPVGSSEPRPVYSVNQNESLAPAGLPQDPEPTVMPKLSQASPRTPEPKSFDGATNARPGATPPGLELPDLPKVNHAEDMFRETDNIPTLEAVGSKSTPPPAGPLRPLTELPDDLASDHGSGGKKIWLIVLIVVLVLGAAGYYAYSKFFGGLAGQSPEVNPENLLPANVNQQPEEANLNLGQEDDPEVIDENTNAEPDCPQLTAPAPDFCPAGEIVTSYDENGCALPAECLTSQSGKDSDKDGLSDEEEESYGTDPFEPDSDGDGLFDREEVKVWHTNPLNPDSDNDGYLDGAEVDAGYNPLGPGKLLDLNFEE